MASLPLAQESTPRRSYGLLGLAIGAAAGYGVYRYQCSHGSDCYSPLGGVLLAAGGGVAGLVVGLLLSPDRSP